MLRVSDVMTNSVVTLSPEMTLAEAANTLSTIGVSGAPVCDDAERVVGVFSQSDVVKLDGPAPEGSLVRHLMTAKVISVGVDESLEVAIASLAANGVHRLMVLDGQGQLAGIITPMDVVKAIAKGRLVVRAPG
ncbi:CBS domain-containing protein [Chondromyces crocatus]|uniref:Signal transduction protein n=1 Tax=Chondromyces crocatus TaxID=52 RepID=A0A0K1EF43_CHOCO|nr:CBS domain-containing protein [Chondromyces crocatus]AKT39312.1 signal transduction protein [Chondromyces crocatus]